MSGFLLCTDLDRTLIPNGTLPESPGARETFRRLVAREDVMLAYVSGRHRELIGQAITEYDLPVPDFVIADVGSSIYRIEAGNWHVWPEWETQIAPDWGGHTHAELQALLQISPALELQEPAKQNRHKLSFYVDLAANAQTLIAGMQIVLQQAGVRANLIWSVDELKHAGLLDVLPASANKLHAIQFLMQRANFSHAATMFAGDSGNDLDVLLSGVQSVLVANADSVLKRQVADANRQTLYVAHGGYLGMNGNYSAGIIEGVAHYWPELNRWLQVPAKN